MPGRRRRPHQARQPIALASRSGEELHLVCVGLHGEYRVETDPLDRRGVAEHDRGRYPKPLDPHDESGAGVEQLPESYDPLMLLGHSSTFQ